MTKSTDAGWMDHIAPITEEADAAYSPGMKYAPHNGKDSDLNLHMADLMAEPNPNVPDPMAGWTPPAAEAGA